MRGRTRACAAAVAAAAVLGASAGTAAAADLLFEFQDTGKIAPCAHSLRSLQEARGEVPNDVEQYAPDYPVALDAAIAARVRGRCEKRRPATQEGTTASPPPAATGSPSAGPPSAGPPSAGPPSAAPAEPSATAPDTSGAGDAAPSEPAAPPAPAAVPPPTPDNGDQTPAAIRFTSASAGEQDAPKPILALGAAAALLALVLGAIGLVRLVRRRPPPAGPAT